MSAFQKKQEFFEQGSELEDYEDSEILENYSELDLESDELDVSPQDLEAEEEIGQRSRVPLHPLRTRPLPSRPLRPRPQPAARRPPAYRPKPPRAIRRHPRSVFVDKPVTCICPEPTCPEHGTEYIRWVQSALNGVLGLRLPVNGVMGPETRSAVRSFQEREGLPVTGIVGPDIESALIAARSGKSPGAEATKPAVPGMPEPAEPATTSPEPDSAKPAAEFDFEWESSNDEFEDAEGLETDPEWFESDWEETIEPKIASPSGDLAGEALEGWLGEWEGGHDASLAAIAERIAARRPIRVSAMEFENRKPARRWTRCFKVVDVERVRKAYQDNAKAAGANSVDRCSCIVMLNVALGQLLKLKTKEHPARSESTRKVQMGALTTDTIEMAMTELRRRGFARPKITINFFDRRNKTAGTLKPERLKTSVQKAVLDRSTVKGCWYAYALSIMAGYRFSEI
jgi:Putative peptidoglycan binding domain